mmetsp:Transcript_43688/g.86670  ORF Transcript_43688/g.86670 Transcript_43688/m.86670 type:complete len:206 (-) Transcript_43688:47-664(-)
MPSVNFAGGFDGTGAIIGASIKAGTWGMGTTLVTAGAGDNGGTSVRGGVTCPVITGVRTARGRAAGPTIGGTIARAATAEGEDTCAATGAVITLTPAGTLLIPWGSFAGTIGLALTVTPRPPVGAAALQLEVTRCILRLCFVTCLELGITTLVDVTCLEAGTTTLVGVTCLAKPPTTVWTGLTCRAMAVGIATAYEHSTKHHKAT